MTEIELKFRVDSLQPLIELLRSIGCTPGPFLTEQSIILDTPDGALRAGGILLRLRQSGQILLLTVKKHLECERAKKREELEIELGSSLEEAVELFEALGFGKAYDYRRERSVCTLEEVEVCLDRFWFGSFVELEGDSIDRVHDAAVRLGLELSKSISESYPELEAEARSRGRREP